MKTLTDDGRHHRGGDTPCGRRWPAHARRSAFPAAKVSPTASSAARLQIAAFANAKGAVDVVPTDQNGRPDKPRHQIQIAAGKSSAAGRRSAGADNADRQI
jgi:hypothetical protein